MISFALRKRTVVVFISKLHLHFYVTTPVCTLFYKIKHKQQANKKAYDNFVQGKKFLFISITKGNVLY